LTQDTEWSFTSSIPPNTEHSTETNVLKATPKRRMSTTLEKFAPHFAIVAVLGFVAYILGWLAGDLEMARGGLAVSLGALTTSCGAHAVRRR